MAEQTALDTLRSVIAEEFEFDVNSIGRSTTAHDVPGWDSVSHTLLMLRVEDTFAIRLPEERVFGLDNVGDLVDLVEEVQGRRSA